MGAASPPVNALSLVHRGRVAMTASLRGLPACNTEACGLSRLKNHSALLVSYLHRLAQLCGLELVVFGTHRFGAINAFQPAHREMAARQAVVLLDKGKVNRGPADGADNCHSLKRELLRDDGSKPGNNRRQSAMHQCGTAVRGAFAYKRIGGQRQTAGEQYPQREIAALGTVRRSEAGVPQREDFETGESGAGTSSRAITAIVRSMIAVDTGNSTGRAARP